jgi:hypothetical protein
MAVRPIVPDSTHAPNSGGYTAKSAVPGEGAVDPHAIDNDDTAIPGLHLQVSPRYLLSYGLPYKNCFLPWEN